MLTTVLGCLSGQWRRVRPIIKIAAPRSSPDLAYRSGHANYPTWISTFTPHGGAIKGSECQSLACIVRSPQCEDASILQPGMWSMLPLRVRPTHCTIEWWHPPCLWLQITGARVSGRGRARMFSTRTHDSPNKVWTLAICTALNV